MREEACSNPAALLRTPVQQAKLVQAPRGYASSSTGDAACASCALAARELAASARLQQGICVLGLTLSASSCHCFVPSSSVSGCTHEPR